MRTPPESGLAAQQGTGQQKATSTAFLTSAMMARPAMGNRGSEGMTKAASRALSLATTRSAGWAQSPGSLAQETDHGVASAGVNPLRVV